ncbi:ATP-binding cassette domain-containing protein [Halomonas sp. 328]|uniref:ATP-binding cassette domain-containing protein n=1 Tax=Halomonas sp. 328 TaxID=2776704 RepID=UPI0018A750AA|nr:ATP-binding cassette domain-containing protein [Halomonas sp. 328]MBF8224462.1 ATP-binding cassette domain-containing protein [Halomonas sp. 328]
MTPKGQLSNGLMRLASIQREVVDRLALHEAVSTSHASSMKGILKEVGGRLGFHSVKWYRSPQAAGVPALLQTPGGGCRVLRGQNGHGGWVVESWNPSINAWEESVWETLEGCLAASITFTCRGQSPSVKRLIVKEFFHRKSLIVAAVFGGMVINVAALASAFYTMQVYDRVVPTGASNTLLVLTLGVFVAILYEGLTKAVRARIYESLIDNVDRSLSFAIYRRFLSVRMDQMPNSVGSLSAQMRGYETVRSFIAAITSQVAVDAPFVILFVAIIYAASGWLAVFPALFLVISLSVGLYNRKRVDRLAQSSNQAVNYRTGLLVESVEGAETIKSGQGGWRMLARWMATTNEARDYDTKIRNISERSQFLVAGMQQCAYVAIVASGALMVSRGELTMGALIATSILTGRTLTPVAAIPNLLIQAAHCKAALKGLDALWALEGDHPEGETPIVIERFKGNYRLDDIEVSYQDNPALYIKKLVIPAGQKVAILGPVGAGKTTLLRILSGMYKPTKGRVFLDDVDIFQLSKPALADQMAYVPQEGRLFSGTLRENLVLGLLDPGDEAIFAAARATGLLEHVVSSHSQGLQQPIYEGGVGLSGGQRQLVHLTRAFLRNPSMWLLDEPTASMDRNLEAWVIHSMKAAIGKTDTLVLVTHKMELLEMVDRVVVVAGHHVVMDGPKEEVLKRLTKKASSPATPRKGEPRKGEPRKGEPRKGEETALPVGNGRGEA